jgi:hypothetical protein
MITGAAAAHRHGRCSPARPLLTGTAAARRHGRWPVIMI